MPTTCKILILQHPQESRDPISSTPLLVHCVNEAWVQVGLSWRSLADALGKPKDSVKGRRWAVLYPYAEQAITQTWPLLTPPDGLIILDGTWQQAKTLWWRNPWLLRLARLRLDGCGPSIYGRLRKEPKKGCLSTLEAAAMALDATGERPEVGQNLRQSFRRWVQRVRDGAPKPSKTSARVVVSGQSAMLTP